MKLLFTTHFDRAYKKAPKKIRQVFDKQSLLLLQNPRHPSLRVKKYNEGEDTWQALSTRTGGSISGLWVTYSRLTNATSPSRESYSGSFSRRLHHEIFYTDGKPYRQEEVDLIRGMTRVAHAAAAR